MSERNKEDALHALHVLPAANPDGENVRHTSILLNDDAPTINKCTNSELFHCPFCKYKGAKYMIANHIKGHSSVKHKEFTMFKCGLNCRTATHFHCCYCAATIINRLQLRRHLQIHQEGENAAGSAQHFVVPVQQPLDTAQHPEVHTECSEVTKASSEQRKFSNSKEDSYPPDDRQIERMLEYLLTNKKLPADIPRALIEQSREGRSQDSFPKHLIPRETKCVECECTLCEQVITSKAKILTSTGVVEGISTYRKSCLNCGMIYRYQEWEEGIHNFDDHIILSLHLCLILRNALQSHTAIGQVLEIIETTEKVSFPNKEIVLQAYLHFEALTDHEYTYTCVSCGHSPAVVVMDLHNKGVFNMPASDIPSPPDSYDGNVDINDFWNAVATEIISRGLIPYGRENSFVVPLSYHHWAPWIGPHTRRSNSVLNTEFEKMGNDGDDYLDGEKMNEEWLMDELIHLKVEAVRALCKQCGVDDKGSKVDLVMRLLKTMSNRVAYNKVFEKVCAASGGLAVITCPCGVVYSVKFNLRAESPRDFVDLLLSWKHFPNVSVYENARGLALHANCREPGIFAPFQGRLLDSTPRNVRLASGGKVCVNMSWLKFPKTPADIDGHPLTGCSRHFAFHQGNGKNQSDVLRKLELVPELASSINSQCVEQMFSGMRENNSFLNLTTPSTRIFLQRNILHHYNMARNQKMKKQSGEMARSDVAMQCDIGDA